MQAGKQSDITNHIKAQKYRTGTRKCDLCLTEKLVILKCNDPKKLNQRSELIEKCQHTKFYAYLIFIKS